MNARLLTGGRTTIDAIFTLYRNHREAIGKRNAHDARSEARILAHFPVTESLDVTPKICRAYAAGRRKQGMSENTIRLELNYLRAALKHAWREEVIDRRPDMELPTSDATRERWLTRDEFDALMEAAHEAHIKLYLLIAIVTAARPSHILALTWDQIDIERGLINFRKAGERQTNKRKPTIPMTDTLRDMLITIRPLARCDHVIEYHERRVQSVKKGIAGAARRAGLEGVTPYVLRHTAGTWMAMAGVPLLEIAERLGHSSIDTTRRHYLHLLPEYMQRSTEVLDVRPRLENR